MKNENIALGFSLLTITILLLAIGFLAGISFSKDQTSNGVYAPQVSIRNDGTCVFLPGGWYDMTYIPRNEAGELQADSAYEVDYADFLTFVANGQVEIKLATGNVLVYQIRDCQIID